MEGDFTVSAKVVYLESILIPSALSRTAISDSLVLGYDISSYFSTIGLFQNTRALGRGFMCLNNEGGLSNHVDAKASNERHGITSLLSSL